MEKKERLVYVTRKAHFNAAHKLYNPNWSKEQNDVVFGKCANEHWHGHNFDLFVTVKGSPNPDTGFIVDLKKLKIIIEREIIEKVDHKNLNLDVDFLLGVLPSIENIVTAFWDILVPVLPEGCTLHKLLLVETENNFVEYFGE